MRGKKTDGWSAFDILTAVILGSAAVFMVYACTSVVLLDLTDRVIVPEKLMDNSCESLFGQGSTFRSVDKGVIVCNQPKPKIEAHYTGNRWRMEVTT